MDDDSFCTLADELDAVIQRIQQLPTFALTPQRGHLIRLLAETQAALRQDDHSKSLTQARVAQLQRVSQSNCSA